MIITRELLGTMKAQAITDRDKLIASVNAQVGAINAIDHLLAVLEQPDSADAEKVVQSATPEAKNAA